MLQRESMAYKIRRRIQASASRVLPKETLSKLYYRIVLHKKLDLKDPKTFNEKIQWMKLYCYPKDPLVVEVTDKYGAREYVSRKGYGDKLVPLHGVWEKAEDIDWEALPESFVLKCTHGCAYNIVVPAKRDLDKKAVVKQLNAWLKEDFGAFNIEPHYSEIKRRRIICEEFLGNKLIDYKFFCFGGKPQFIYVSSDLIHDREAQMGFFELDGEKIPLKRDDYADLKEIVPPPFYSEMLSAAESLSGDFPFVRVDFFITEDRWFFAELTFTPGAGMMPIEPESYDVEWGKLIDLDAVKKKTR